MDFLKPLSRNRDAASQRMRRASASWKAEKKPLSLGIRVAGGLQHGTYVELEATEVRIGSDLSSNVVLLDDSVPSHAATLIFDAFMLGAMMTVQAGDADVSLQDRTLSAGDISEPLVLPISLKLTDDVAVTIDNPIPTQEARPLLERATRMVMVGLAASAAVLTLIFVLDFFFHSDMDLVFLPEPDLHDEVAAEMLTSRIAELETRIAESGLSNNLILDTNTEGVVRITGGITESDRQEWTSINRWYDGLEGAPPMFSEVRMRPNLTELPPITVVMLSEPRTLFLAGGQRITTGDELIDGWLIERIDEDGIALVRGVENAFVTF